VQGPRVIRLSVVGGRGRVHRLIDRAAGPGAVVVDIRAHVGYNTIYASRRVGPSGRVVAIEPAADNLRILRENVAINGIGNVVVQPVAAGAAAASRDLFLRGEHSAVNSVFETSVYGTVTAVERVRVAPVDDLVEGRADLVKIDVEGAELDVLAGMSRLLEHPGLRLIVEWHPGLQEAAGYEASALPRFLLECGFSLRAVGHTGGAPLTKKDVERVETQMRHSTHPVELDAWRA